MRLLVVSEGEGTLTREQQGRAREVHRLLERHAARGELARFRTELDTEAELARLRDQVAEQQRAIAAGVELRRLLEQRLALSELEPTRKERRR